MSLEIIETLIGCYGFPIVACCYLARQNEQLQITLNDLKITLSKLEEKLEKITK